MEKLMHGIIAITVFAYLTGCESFKDSDDNCVSSTIAEDDMLLRNSAADFIANAGDRIFFAYDSSSISSEAAEILARQVKWLKNNSTRKVLIEGHCDERGTREYNLGLGERRADTVARALMQHGISGDRIRTVSYGKDRPISAQGTTEEINRINRVAIVVIE